MTATLDKLVKAFEALRVFQLPNVPDDDLAKKKDAVLGPKERALHCGTICDCICALGLRSQSDFPKFLGIALETFLFLCDDGESDVRMVADECLNRTIKILLETNLGRIQVELYKEIKKNGSPRTLRAALWRFADICHLIRPQKCRPYVLNLLPCIARISRRPEESIQDTLAVAMQKICPVLIRFTLDAEVEGLIKSLLPNLGSDSASARRAAASSLALVCSCSRKVPHFSSWLLSALLDLLVPVLDTTPVHLLLGVFQTIRHLMPVMAASAGDDDDVLVTGSFGQKTNHAAQPIDVMQILQVYEVLLNYTNHADHNIVTSVLETLHQMLKTPPAQLMVHLITPASIPRSTIFEATGAEQEVRTPRFRLGSEGRLPSVCDESTLDDEFDPESERMTSTRSDDTDPPSVIDDAVFSDYSDGADGGDHHPGQIAESDSRYSVIEIGEFNSDDGTASRSNSVENLASPQHKDENGAAPFSGLETNEQEYAASEHSSTQEPIAVKSGDVGALSTERPLVYGVRLLASRFLLTGYPGGRLTDRMSRVSVKTLALNCIAAAVSYYPQVLFGKLFVGPDDEQRLSDILLLSSHHDPQIRGHVTILIGQLLQACLLVSRGHYGNWLAQMDANEKGALGIDHLVRLLTSTTNDESSVAVRLALCAVRCCLRPLMHSDHGAAALQTLRATLALRSSPYWLVKIELLELLVDVDFKVLYYLESVDSQRKQDVWLQEIIVEDVVLYLLADEDARVRDVAAEILTKLIPNLFYPTSNPLQDSTIILASQLTEQFLSPVMLEWSQTPPALVHGLVAPYHYDPATTVSGLAPSLARVVGLLHNQLLVSDGRGFSAGCCKALRCLSQVYPTTQYPGAWGCVRPQSTRDGDRSRRSASTGPGKTTPGPTAVSPELLDVLTPDDVTCTGGGLLSLTVCLLTSAPLALNITSHQNLLHVTGNLIAGLVLNCLQPVEDVAAGRTDATKRWMAVSDRSLVHLLDKTLVHLVRLLSVCCAVIEEQSPGPPASKSPLSQLATAPSLSPIKIKTKNKGDEATEATPSVGDAKSKEKSNKKDKDSDDKKHRRDGLGMFYNLPHYMRLYDILKGAYSNYQTSLDMASPDKFCGLVSSTLSVLSQLLETVVLSDIAGHADEILALLKTLVSLEPSATVLCVQQLLKALFGMNLASLWSADSCVVFTRRGATGQSGARTKERKQGMYHYCLTRPYTQLTQTFAAALTRTADSDDPNTYLGWLRKCSERRFPAILKPGSQADKSSIASYIRLFEPLVIKALKLYTITSCLELQCRVLDLLTQLVQLRVNYCLLDSDQVFIGFILKQFEHIEEGNIRRSELLIPHIFKFLVLLSYERYHSKLIVGMPKVIQLCDGIMASEQQPTTHAIPALRSIVHDLFVMRNGTSAADNTKDLETQREVLVSMLLRVLRYYQVLELMMVVFDQLRADNEDKWKRLSRQVVDLVLPLLAKQQINIEDQAAFDVVHRLLDMMPQSVFRPVDTLLRMLLESSPTDSHNSSRYHRWLAFVCIVVRILVVQSKENVILSRLYETRLGGYGQAGILLDGMASMESSMASADGDSLDGSDGQAASELTMARFLLHVVNSASRALYERCFSPIDQTETNHFLAKLLAHFLLYLTHMFQSGVFRRITSATRRLLRESHDDVDLDQTNRNFLSLSNLHPTLTLQWCNILTLVGYDGADWWSEVLTSPTKGREAPRSTPYQEVVRKGGLMLFCDYVCGNLSDAEHMISVIVNHVNDLVELSHEPPVQDFISAIHRNPSASGLFIQAIHSRCGPMPKLSTVCKMLRCLEAVHLSQSGPLLVLLIDRFLPTHHLAMVRLTDGIACRRLEMLLAEQPEEITRQLPTHDLHKLIELFGAKSMIKRHTRLYSLLVKLYNTVVRDTEIMLHDQTNHPVSSLSLDGNYTLNKECFHAITKQRAFTTGAKARECAMLLQWLDYQDIYAIMSSKEFNLFVLEECIALGLHKTLIVVNKARDSVSGQSDTAPSTAFDPLLMASQRTLFKRIRTVISVLPSGAHQLVLRQRGVHCQDAPYLDQVLVLLTDASVVKNCRALAAALVRYLVSLKLLPQKTRIPSASLAEIVRFTAFYCEMSHHDALGDLAVSSIVQRTLLELVSVVLQHDDLFALLSQGSMTTVVYTYTALLHTTLTSAVKFPGLEPWMKSSVISEQFSEKPDQVEAWWQIVDLLYAFKTFASAPSQYRIRLPVYTIAPMRNAVIGLARLPQLNTFAVIPRVVWSLNWQPKLEPNADTIPPLPLDYLQDKDVLSDFIYCANTVGWTSRQQFEETWMSLLGVINPVVLEELQTSPEEEIERTQCTVLAIRAITKLLIQSLRAPQAGNPANSVYEHRSRDRPLPFLNTRNGKKLAIVRGLLEKEIQPATRLPSSINTHHHYTTMGRESQKFKYLYDHNTERDLGFEDFAVHQVSVESIWSTIGIQEEGDDDTPFDGNASATTRPRTVSLSGLDIHSCLQFLLDLYKQWLSPGTKIPLMQLNEAVKSIVILSDLFTEKHQFEWMIDNLLEVQRFHPWEDELANQYLVIGLCKAASIVGMDIVILEKVSRTLEASLRSTHLSSRIGGLYGCLYLLEGGMTEGLLTLLPSITAYVQRQLSGTVIHVVNCEQHVLLLWATAFNILEKHGDQAQEGDFHGRIIQHALQTLNKDGVPLCVYMAVLRGLERLIVAETLTPPQVESLIKLSKDKLYSPNPQRMLSALGMLLTCMYSGKRGEHLGPSLSEPDYQNGNDVRAHYPNQDPETLINDMERVAILFERTRKGYPIEASVISRILPTFLTDFFPAQDIMNKVIGEFLSNQQSHPQLMSKVVFQVFNSLHQQKQYSLVRDWVMLSLSNFTQRTPMSMAIWSLTCFFISASTNQWLRALLHHIIERMGKIDLVDSKLFCIAAMDFYSQIPDESSRKVFLSTFQTLAVSDTPYQDLTSCLRT